MSGIQFIESQSADPFERAIAEKVAAIFDNPHIDSVQRQWLVQQAQQALLEHRRQRDRAQQLAQHKPSRKQRGPRLDPIAARRQEMRQTATLNDRARHDAKPASKAALRRTE